jgi:hypothetical protein
MRNMALTVLILLAAHQSAFAANVNGNGVLSLAALIAEHSPLLTAKQKSTMDHLFNGILTPPPPSATIYVKADNVVCRISDVDITEHSCALTFGPSTVNLKGRRAHELYATIGEVGVPPDGAAGSVFEALSNLNCTINPSDIAQRAGSGASCTFDAGAKSTSAPNEKK